MRWKFPLVNKETVTGLSRALGISPLLARLLVIRGVDEAEAAQRFLHPRLDHLHDPMLMADMRAAVERLRRAIANREKILIYGDYDVDGTMAAVVLLTALRALGADVEAHVPHRLTEGYGMRAEVIERRAAEGFRVVISVDTGIREHQAIARGRALGVDCIITDHHLPEEHLPAACAILNPRRPDCAYPEKNLSGVGLAFKLAQALRGTDFSDRLIQSYLKVVAIGTIADVVPLVGENRVIAQYGLAGLRAGNGGSPGLRALLATAGLEGKAITAGHVGFRIAPRLNAAGRMGSAREVIDLLTTPEVSKAYEIAERLERLNRERQRVEDEMLREIESRVELQTEKKECYSMVFSGEGWHRGVIGIVAQRVVDRYHRPTLVIGIEDGVGVGSARSIREFHLLEALTTCGDLFERYGGHAQAAGFTLPATRIPELEARFERCARKVLKPEDLEPLLRVDAELDLGEIDWPLFEELRRLEPHGVGNPTPVFASRALGLVLPPRVLKEKHLKLKMAKGGKTFDALAWGRAGQAKVLAPGQVLDAAYCLEENVYQSAASLQLVIRDLCKSDEELESREMKGKS